MKQASTKRCGRTPAHLCHGVQKAPNPGRKRHAPGIAHRGRPVHENTLPRSAGLLWITT